MSKENVEFVRQTMGLLAGQDMVAFFKSANQEDLRQMIDTEGPFQNKEKYVDKGKRGVSSGEGVYKYPASA